VLTGQFVLAPVGVLLLEIGIETGTELFVYEYRFAEYAYEYDDPISWWPLGN
jgi:hypothetical protein